MRNVPIWRADDKNENENRYDIGKTGVESPNGFDASTSRPCLIKANTRSTDLSRESGKSLLKSGSRGVVVLLILVVNT